MKKNYIFGLIFLLFCGLLNAHASTAISDNSELSVSLDFTAMNTADTTPMPWYQGFEGCNCPTASWTRYCASGLIPADTVTRLDITTTPAAFGSGNAWVFSTLTKPPVQTDAFNYIPRTDKAFLRVWSGGGLWLFTPGFALEKGKTYTFSFWYFANGRGDSSSASTNAPDAWTLKTMVGEGASAGEMSVVLDYTIPQNTYYQQCKVRFTPTKDYTTYYFGVYVSTIKKDLGLASGTGGMVAFDDFEVSELSACPEPKEPIAQAGPGFIDLKWNSIAEASKYIIEYKPTTGQGLEYQKVYATDTAFRLTGLAEVKEYTIGIRSICGTTDTGIRSPQIPIVTDATPTPIITPHVEDFENPTNNSKWVFIDRGSNTKWTVGDSTFRSGKSSLYGIFPNYGQGYQTVGRVIGGAGIIYAYKDFVFPDGTAEFSLKFDYKGNDINTSNYYFAKVYLLDSGFVLKKNMVLPDSLCLKTLANAPNWRTEDIRFGGSKYPGKTKRLVFAGIGRVVSSLNGLLAVDNIVIDRACKPLDSLVFTGFADSTRMNVAWGSETGTEFQVQYKTATGLWTAAPGPITTKTYTVPSTLYKTFYDIRVRNYCGATDVSDWKQISVLTPQVAKQVPFTESFDSASHGSDWSIANGSQKNQWYIKRFETITGLDTIRNYAAYISYYYYGTPFYQSSDYSGTNSTATSIVHLYRDVAFPTGSNNFVLSFDWTAWGSMYADYLKVSIADIDDVKSMPFAGQIPAQKTLADYSLRDTLAPPAHTQLVLPASEYAGKTKRLIFTWTNDNSTGGEELFQRAATIDNIKIDILSCLPPVNIVAVPYTDSIKLAWTTTTTSATLKYRSYNAEQAPDANWTSVSATNGYTLKGCGSNTMYEFSLKATCGTAYDTAFTVRSLQIPLPAGTFTEDFNQTSSLLNWTTICPPNRDYWTIGQMANLPTDNESDLKAYIRLKNVDSNTNSRHSNSTYYYLYRDFMVPANTKEYQVSFDWKAKVGGANHNLSVYLTDIDTPLPTYSAPQANKIENKDFRLSDVWKNETLFTPIEVGSTKKRLVFVWKVDSLGTSALSSTPPTAPAIDNVTIKPLTAHTPTNVVVTPENPNSLRVEWTSSTDSVFVVSYQPEGTHNWTNDTVRIGASVTPKTTTLINLDYNGVYNVRVKVAETNETAPTLPVSGRVYQLPAIPDFVENFSELETTSQWTFIQEGQKNRWFMGEFGKNSATDTCLYVKDYSATSFPYFYDNNTKSISHVYREVEFYNSPTYTLSFDWRAVGSPSEMMKIYVVDMNTTPVAGASLPLEYLVDNRSHTKIDWTSSTIILPQSVKNSKKRIVFTWENDVSVISNQPATSLDNVEIKGSLCTPPENLSVTGRNTNDLSIAWASSSSQFEVQYRVQGSNAWMPADNPFTNTLTITGLAKNTTYEIRVRAACDISNNSAWSSTFKATTKLPAATLPLIDNFDIFSWETANGNLINRWVQGIAPGGTSAYVSNNNGITNDYSKIPTTIYLYRDIIFPPAPQYALTFDWKLRGAHYDHMRTYLLDTSVVPKAGTVLLTTDKGVYSIGRESYHSQMTWKNDTIYFPDTLAGKTMRLAFAWHNIDYLRDNTNPPAAIDNLRFIPLSCITPTNLNAVYPALREAKLSWSAGSDNNFRVFYRKKGTTTWDSVSNTPNPTILTGLSINTEYEYQVLNTCGGNDIYKSTPKSFITLQIPTSTPFNDNFQDSVKSAQWTLISGDNHWFIGKNDSVKDVDARSLFVERGGYNSYRYSRTPTGAHNNTERYAYAFRDIDFDDSPKGFKLVFDWVCQGLAAYNIKGARDMDNLQVFLVDRDLVLDPAQDIPHQYLLSEKRYFGHKDNDNPLKDSLFIPANVSNTKKRLVFRWVNQLKTLEQDYIGGSSMVDNVSIKAVDCSIPRLQANQEFLDSVAFTWNTSGAGIYNLQYAETGSAKWESISLSDTSYGVKGLKPNTSYTARVVSQECESNMSARITFTTPMRLAYFDNFEGFKTTGHSTQVLIDKPWEEMYGFLSYQKNEPTKLYGYDVVNLLPTWKGAKFAYINTNNVAASIEVRDNTCDAWLISPDFYLAENDSVEVSFKLGMTKQMLVSVDDVSGIDNVVGEDDRFGILISNDDNWTIADTLAFWSNDTAIHSRSYQKIANSRYGERIVLPLKGFSKGRYKIAFYAESTEANATNTIFVDSLYIQRPGVCEQVSELKVSDITHSSSKATWTGDYYQKQWEIKWVSQTNPTDKGNSFASTTNNPILGLLPSKTYNVTARGICGVGDTSAWVQAISFKTLSNCDTIANISAVPDSLSAIVKWSSNGANKAGYLYCYGTAGKTIDQLTPTFTADSSFKAEGLTPVTDYVAYIRPICSSEDTGSWSSYNFRTLKLTCGIPAKPSVSGITSTTAKSHCIAAYRSVAFEFRYGSNNITENMHPECTDKTSVEMKGLAPASTYYCAVRAICGTDDTSSFSEISQFSTLACTEVTDVNVNWVEDEATITWKTKGGQSKWEVLLIGNESKITIVNDSVYKIQRSALTPGVTYTIKVRTMCGSDYSAYSDPKILLGIANNILPEGVRISVSPNPATTHANLSIEGVDGKVNVELFSLRGELITSEVLNCNLGKTKELSLRGLAKGTYTIRVIHEKWVETLKLIVN